MKKLSLELVLSTLGVIGILLVGLFTVNCELIAAVDKGEIVPLCEPKVITGDFETQYSFTTTADIAAGETFDKSLTINLATEFAGRYDVDLDSLKTYFVTLAQASFTEDRCADLDFYSISIDFPQLGPVTDTQPCDFSEFSSAPDPTGMGRIAFHFSSAFPSTNPTAIAALATDFANDFKTGKTITATARFGAKNNIPAGFGVVLVLKSKMTYGVCE